LGFAFIASDLVHASFVLVYFYRIRRLGHQNYGRSNLQRRFPTASPVDVRPPVRFHGDDGSRHVRPDIVFGAFIQRYVRRAGIAYN